MAVAAFDPETAGVAAPASPAAPAPSFDPEVAGVAWSPELAGAEATPQQKMQALAPIVSKADASPQDDQAYVQAYKDYYSQNSTASRLGEAVKAPFSASFWSNAAGGLWNKAKAKASSTADDINNIGATAAGVPMPTAGQALAAGQGLAGGLAKLGTGTLSLMLAADDQWKNLESDATGNAQYRDQAAQNALTRLKASAGADAVLASPYQPGTRENAYFNLGQDASNFAPLPVADAAGLGKVVQGTGDVIEHLGNQALAASMQTAGQAEMGLKAASAAGGAWALIKHPAAAVPTLLADLLLNGEIPSTVTAGSVVKSSAIRSGLFRGLDTLGQTVQTTPLGQSALDSLVQNSPTVLANSTAMTQAARKAVLDAQDAYNQAKATGISISPFNRQLKITQKAAAAAEAHQFVIEKGTQFAGWLQKNGANGMSRTMANSAAGVIVGGALGGTVAGLQGQPGQTAQNMGTGMAMGAGYGLILGQLGQAAVASPPGPSALRQAAEQSAVNRFETGATTTAEAAAAPQQMDSIILDGIPHPADVVAENLRAQGQQLVQHIRQEPPINETFDMPWVSTREMGKWGALPHPGDSQIQSLLAAHLPIESSAIYSGAYNPETEMASVFFRKGKASGNYHHYVFGQVPADDWAGLLKGDGFDGSIGKAFNGWFRNEYPYGEVMKAPPAPPAASPSSSN